jgi:polar amino acid transport system permease protein
VAVQAHPGFAIRLDRGQLAAAGESQRMIQSFGWSSIPFLLNGAMFTVVLSVITFVTGGVIGLTLALFRTLGPKPVRYAIAGYVELIQATPLLILLFLAYYGLSFIGLFFPPLIAAALSLTLYAAAFLCEIWRGCIEAIPRQQWEAADSLAMSVPQKLRYVILPQAFRIALGPTVGFMVQIIKNTSVTALISFVELTRAGQLLNNMTFQPFHVFLTVAGMYFVVCYPLSLYSEYLKGGQSARRPA